MAYTPVLPFQSSYTLRRIAWALDVPMTEVMEKGFYQMPRMLDRQRFVRDIGTRPSVRTVYSEKKDMLYFF